MTYIWFYLSLLVCKTLPWNEILIVLPVEESLSHSMLNIWCWKIIIEHCFLLNMTRMEKISDQNFNYFFFDIFWNKCHQRNIWLCRLLLVVFETATILQMSWRLFFRKWVFRHILSIVWQNLGRSTIMAGNKWISYEFAL